MNYLKVTRWFAVLTGITLGIYGLYFYSVGYSTAWMFGLWAFVCFAGTYYASKQPFYAYLGITITSFVLYFVLRYHIPEMRDWPHHAVFVLILMLFVGATWDGYQWVYKFDHGRKLKSSYED
jgi:hypothetical protein